MIRCILARPTNLIMPGTKMSIQVQQKTIIHYTSLKLKSKTHFYGPCSGLIEFSVHMQLAVTSFSAVLGWYNSFLLYL